VAGTPEPDGDESGAPERRRSIVETWIEVFADAGGLVRAEARLARAETAENLKALGRQTAKLVAGTVLLAMALVFLTVAAVAALAQVTGLLAALLIVTAGCVVVGAVLLRSGAGRLSGQSILPERSLGRMSRDLDNLAARAAPLEPLVPIDGVRPHEAT
jgi:hypothetical protein